MGNTTFTSIWNPVWSKLGLQWPITRSRASDGMMRYPVSPALKRSSWARWIAADVTMATVASRRRGADAHAVVSKVGTGRFFPISRMAWSPFTSTQ